MPVTREILFCNNCAYSIRDTRVYIAETFMNADSEMFPDDRFTTIMNHLENVMHDVIVDFDAFIPDPYSGVLIMFDLWLHEWGVMDGMFMDFPDHLTVATYPTTDSEFEMEGEEAITAEEHDELIVGSVILTQMDEEYVLETDEEEI